MNESKAVLPLKINIASPCHARWEDMGGDDRVRFCDQCRKNVYNLSAMSNAEAAGLLQEKNGNLCARIYQRGDGTVLTEDCPVGLAQYWRKIKLVTTSVAALFLFAMANLASFARGGDSAGTNGSSNNPIATNRTTMNQMKEPRDPLMGRIAVRPGSQNAPPRPLMGKVAVMGKPLPGTNINSNAWKMGEVAFPVKAAPGANTNSTAISGQK